jgi:SagB-type dehydrogenase family enzyme
MWGFRFRPERSRRIFFCPGFIAGRFRAGIGNEEREAMTTLTKIALGMMGALRPKPATGDSATSIALPPPQKHGGLPLMEALARRSSSRDFSRDPLPLPVLSNLLWAAYGINRADGGRTAPSALNAQEIDVFVALSSGAYRYDPAAHALHLVAASDLRSVTGYQDFVDEAPLDLVYVADHGRMGLVPVAQRECYASAAAGAIAQNVYLFAASSGLATVIRAWIDRAAIADALGLSHDQQVLLSQTVGYPRLVP